VPAPSMPYRSKFEFGPFQLNVGERLLPRNAEVVHLPPKTFDLLLVLLSQRGHLISKVELRRLVWPDTFVDEINLAQHVSILRRALRDGEDDCRYIETVPKMGYRFIAQVRAMEETGLQPQVRVFAQAIATEMAKASRTIVRLSRLLHFPRKNTFALCCALAVFVIAGLSWGLLFSVKWHARVQADQNAEQAKQNYSEGRYFWLKRTGEGYRAAIAHFEEAVKLKPDYAEAYAGLADCYILLGSFGVEPLRAVLPKARAAALRAVELNERSAEAHVALAYIMSRFDWNWNDADREFRRAIELSPEDPTAHHWYALHLVNMRRTDEAITEMRTAQKLDPSSPILNTDMALVLYYARHYNEALLEALKVIHSDSSFGLAHRTLGLIYSSKGKYREAIAEFSVAVTLLDDDPWTLAEMGRTYALLGNREKALAEFEDLKELSKHRFVAPTAFALLAASLPEKRDQSFRWLEQDYDARSSNTPLLAIYPGFDAIRDDPRFQNILNRVGLPATN
jgi:DNA-binding winged helix-turn-helix (wHTH) protein/Flp pilus assembly protein TadD